MWKSVYSVLEEGKCGDFEIKKFAVSRNDIRAMLDGIPPGNYVSLRNNLKCIMSDTPMEKRTNSWFVANAFGDVLIGGLGIGMILLAIQDKECVKSITVIEKNQEVIDLVLHQLPLNKKVNVIHADVFDWKPQKGVKYDCVYMDIWSGINRDIYKKQMVPLKRKYSRYLKIKEESPDRFNKCWAEWNAKNEVRLR